MRIALTFDTEPAPLGQDPANAERILDALAAHAAPATFFLQGEWVRQNPGLAERLSAEGHLVGNHTQHHVLLGKASKRTIRRETREAEETIREVTGLDPRPWFRCPQNSGAHDERVLSVIASLGYRQVGWSFDSFDWQLGCGEYELARTVVRGCDAFGDGAVVLLHSWPDVTAAALPSILQEVSGLGATFVRLDALSL